MVVSTDGFIFGQLLVENLFIPIVGQVVYSKFVGIQGETKLAHQHQMGQFQFSIYEDSTSGNIASSTKKISHLSKKCAKGILKSLPRESLSVQINMY